MKRFSQTSEIAKAVRKISAAALIAAVVALPTTGSAGTIDEIKRRVDQTYNKVNDTRNRVLTIYWDVKEKKDMVQGEAGEMIKETVRSMVEYLQKAQAGYSNFVGVDNCGPSSPCGVFRAQLRKLIEDFINLPQDLPFVERVPAVVEQLQEMAGMVEHIPPVVLYTAEKVLGNMFDEIQHGLDMIRYAASQVPPIPTTTELNQALAGASKTWIDQKCQQILVTDAPHIALLQQSLSNLEGLMTDIAGEFQDSIVINASVGTSVSNPAKKPFSTAALAAKMLNRNLSLRLAVVNSFCAAAGFTAEK